MAEPALGRPGDIDLFSSNALFGQPGIYPDGSPMVPASGPDWTEDSARAALVAIPGLVTAGALDRYDDPALTAVAPDPGVRAGLSCLAATVAVSLLDAFAAGTAAAATITYGTPASPGRVVGPPADGPPAEGPTDDATVPGTDRVRVVNDRYRFEHPALLAGSLAHDLLWEQSLATVHAAEATLHALVAMVHVQLLVLAPELASTTELARRQSSLAITLLNSRHPGDARISLIAPDGPGTIPGGAPGMQTPDFWSVPFAPVGSAPAPPHLVPVLARLVSPVVPRPDPLVLDEAFGTWLSDHLDERWLLPADRAAVRRTLTLAP